MMKSLYKVGSLALLFLLCLIYGTSCGNFSVKPLEKSYFSYFDTVCSIRSYNAKESKKTFEEHCRLAEEVLAEYHDLLNVYTPSERVNLYFLNKEAGKAPVKVEKELFDFLVYGKEIESLTKGETNIAMGAVLSLWHDCYEKSLSSNEKAVLPKESDLKEAASHIQMEDVILDAENRTVFFSDPELSLDGGALAKGYVAQIIDELLRKNGADSYLLNLGGTVFSIGRKSKNSPFTVGIRNPERDASGFAFLLENEDLFVVTSGDYERYFEVEGKRYHHIIDKDTLFPSEYYSSVTVLTKDAALGDALSTALFSMDVASGKALLEKLPMAEVCWISKEGTIEYTNGFQKYIVGK